MKNKSLIYLLIPIVGFVWYKVFIRIKSNLEPETVLATNSVNTLEKLYLKRDTFALKADYRDPFTDKTPNPSSSTLTSSTTSLSNPLQNREPKPKIDRTIVWYPIKYYGLLKKVDSKDALAVINVDREQFFLRKGQEVFDGYKLEQITKDSVLIRYRGEKKYFRKEK